MDEKGEARYFKFGILIDRCENWVCITSKRLGSGARNFLNLWQISDNISKTVKIDAQLQWKTKEEIIYYL